MKIDPRDLVLDISREYWLGVADPDARFLESWGVEAHVSDESGTRVTHVGDCRILILRVEEARVEGVDLLGDVLDAHTSDLAEIGTVLLDPEENDLREDLRLSAPGDLMILDRVRLDPLYRGEGLGPILAGASIHQLSRGCAGVACIPAPTEGDLKEAARAQAIMRLRSTWALLGFRHVDDNVWLLDLGLITLGENLKALLSEHPPSRW